MMLKIGFIGLGIKGEPMAANILKAGHDLWVYSRTPGKTGYQDIARASMPATHAALQLNLQGGGQESGDFDLAAMQKSWQL